MVRTIVQLSDFDPEPLVEYAITERELTSVYQYLQAMQAHLDEGTWEEISSGGYYGTSALLHEVVETRILLSRDPYLLTRSAREIKAFARLTTNRDAHVNGLEAEYSYLQKVIHEVFEIHVDVGALLQANSRRPQDWDDLFETNLPFFSPSYEDVASAEIILKQLREIKLRSS